MSRGGEGEGEKCWFYREKGDETGRKSERSGKELVSP